MSNKEFVVTQLRKLPQSRGLTFKGQNAWIRCPHHSKGRENTPSLSINLENKSVPIGTFHCLSCGVHGNYNKIAKDLGIKELKNISDYDGDYIEISNKDEEEFFGSLEENSTKNMQNWDPKVNWRGISGKLLHKIGAKLEYNNIGKDNQLYLPISVFGEEIGGINCILDRKSSKIRAYFNSSDLKSKKALFPYDYVKKRNKGIIIISEGPRDVLNLNQYGLSALAILGTRSWSDYKKDLILSLNPKKIILALDPDEAGEKATRRIYRDFKNFVKVTVLKLPKGKDPADLDIKDIIKLKKLIGI